MLFWNFLFHPQAYLDGAGGAPFEKKNEKRLFLAFETIGVLSPNCIWEHCDMYFTLQAYQCSGVTITTKPKVLSDWSDVPKPLSDWLDLLWWNHWQTLILLSSLKYETVCVGCQNWRQQRKNVKNSVKMHHQMNSSDIGNNFIIIFKIFSIWMPRYDFYAKFLWLCFMYIFFQNLF